MDNGIPSFRHLKKKKWEFTQARIKRGNEPKGDVEVLKGGQKKEIEGVG